VRDHQSHVIATISHTTCTISILVIVAAIAASNAAEFSCNLGQNFYFFLEADSLPIVNAIKTN